MNPPGAIRLMPWNIHGGRPLIGKRDLARVISFVRPHDPDIVAVQGVDARWTAAAFDMLSEALGIHRAEARMIVAPEGDRGHVARSQASRTYRGPTRFSADAGESRPPSDIRSRAGLRPR